MTKLYGFDVEISKGFPEDGSHWSKHAPLGISCAALSTADGSFGMLWYSSPGSIAMKPKAVEAMVRYIAFLASKGNVIVTWNGIGFDWRALTYEVPELHDLLVKLAKHTYDPCYSIFKQRGFPVGLEAACIGQGVEGKLADVGGAAAVQMWQHNLSRGKVLEYVVQDARATAQVAHAIRDTGDFRWQTRNKTLSSETMALMPGQHFMNMPMPDQSWMSDPLTEAHFTGWF